MNWILLQNSLLVSTLATLLAMGMGVLTALCLMGLSRPWKNFFLLTSIVALAMPPFLVTNCWLHYLGHGGVWRSWLPLDIFSLGGTVWILALLTWPVTLLLVLGAWQKLEPIWLEIEPALTGWALLRRLLIPMARPALAQAAVVTFVFALNNFAVPAILQTKVFPAEVWVSFNTTFDYATALKLSWPLVVVPLLVLFWLNRQAVAWSGQQSVIAARVFRQRLGRGWFNFGGLVSVLLIALSVALPLVQLASTSRTWTEFLPAFAAGQASVLNTLTFAAVAATLTVLLGLFTWRWKWGQILWIPFLIPGVLLGIGLIAAMNRPPFITFYQSAGIVILALVIRYAAFGWTGAAEARRSVDSDLTDVARLNGASPWQLFRHAHWPQMAASLAAVWYVTYLLCLWDVETVVLIIPPGGETLALRIFNLLHYGHNTQVNALCVLLLLLAVAPLLAWLVWARLRRAGVAVGVALAAALCLTSCTPPPGNHVPIESRYFSAVEIIGTRGTGAGELNKPRSVALDAQDNLYVVDMTGRVQKFTPDGKFILSWQMPQTDKGKPKGMCTDTNGDIVLVEPHYSRVNHFSREGKLTAQWGTNGTNVGQFSLPRAVAISPKGDTYVSEYGLVDRVQRFSAQGRHFIGSIGKAGTGPGEFSRPEGLGVDKEGRVYVADSCNHRIQILSPDGQFLREYGTAGRHAGEVSYPYDVRVDSTGLQFVCEFGNSRIQIFDTNCKSVEVIGGPGAEPGRFANPWSVALDSQGNLYVADSMNHRVQKFIRKGTESTGGKHPGGPSKVASIVRTQTQTSP